MKTKRTESRRKRTTGKQEDIYEVQKILDVRSLDGKVKYMNNLSSFNM
jgi:hypothetical protein